MNETLDIDEVQKQIDSTRAELMRRLGHLDAAQACVDEARKAAGLTTKAKARRWFA